MAILISRKYLIVIFLSSMYQHTIGQCPDSLSNTVLLEGETLTFPIPVNRKCAWTAIFSNNFFNRMLRVTDSSTIQLYPDFLGSHKVGPSGLTILKGSASPVGGSPWSTAGQYTKVDMDAKCNSSAKVAVIQSGPTCQCNSSTKNKPAEYSCSVIYADSPAIPMYAQFTWYSANDKDTYTDVPLARRKSILVFRAESSYPPKFRGKRSAIFKPKNCVLTFLAPPHGRLPNIARNAPTYSASCSFNCN